MKVTIENVEEVEKGWLKSKPIHKLYVTLELTNEEIFVLDGRYHLLDFTLVEGVDDPNGPGNYPHKPKISSNVLTDTTFKGKIRGTANRVCVFSHRENHWVNYNEDLLNQGLKKWKAAIDAEAQFHKKRPEKKTLDL